MPALTWKHHALIQALQSRGPLSEKEFHLIFAGVTGKTPDTHQDHFKDYLLKINKELSYVQFELRACRNQYDGNVHYGIVNTVSDEQSKLGTKYSAPQVAFFRAILEAITQDGRAQGCISNFDALNIRLENQVINSVESESQGGHIPTAFKNFSMSQKEKTIEELIQDEWLSSDSDYNIRLGVRAFLDLRSWFHSNEVPFCEVCNEPGVKAEVCQNESCTVRMHLYCLQRKFSQRKVEKVCPGCGTQWHVVVSKLEDAGMTDQNETACVESSQEPISRRLRKNETAHVESSQEPISRRLRSRHR